MLSAVNSLVLYDASVKGARILARLILFGLVAGLLFTISEEDEQPLRELSLISFIMGEALFVFLSFEYIMRSFRNTKSGDHSLMAKLSSHSFISGNLESIRHVSATAEHVLARLYGQKEDYLEDFQNSNCLFELETQDSVSESGCSLKEVVKSCLDKD